MTRKNHRNRIKKGMEDAIPVTAEQFTKALTDTWNIEHAKEHQKGFLCMFSGGLDSTALLHSLLTNKNYENFDVYVHHMRILNRENRSDAETAAARNIIQHYHGREDVREFDYKETTLDLSTMTENWSPRFTYDMDAVAFMAAQICLAKPNIKYAAMGVMKDDFDKAAQDRTAALRYQSAPNIFNAMLYDFPQYWPHPTLIYPLQKISKEELWKTIPPNIRQMTWSCRRPVWKQGVPHKCERCEPCTTRKEAGIDS